MPKSIPDAGLSVILKAADVAKLTRYQAEAAAQLHRNVVLLGSVPDDRALICHLAGIAPNDKASFHRVRNLFAVSEGRLTVPTEALPAYRDHLAAVRKRAAETRWRSARAPRVAVVNGVVTEQAEVRTAAVVSIAGNVTSVDFGGPEIPVVGQFDLFGAPVLPAPRDLAARGEEETELAARRRAVASAKKAERDAELDAEFTVFWTAYPLKTGKGVARVAFGVARSGAPAKGGKPARAPATLAVIMDGLATHIAGKRSRSRGSFVEPFKHPASFLNGEFYLDEAAQDSNADVVYVDPRYFDRPASFVRSLPQPADGTPELHAWHQARHYGFVTEMPENALAKPSA